ncbi:MAG: DUF1800 domain-containing protein [Planctomycetota bacterium]|nr:DUF1800 domain-containing protein [Planctomycetota bacterium]
MSNDIMAVDPGWAWAPFEPSAEQPWNRRRAAHLCRRAGFGATSEELDRIVKTDPTDFVASVIRQATAAAQIDPAADALATAMLATGNSKNLAAWWLYRMLNSQWPGDNAPSHSPLLEKLALFWHGHFATGADKVDDVEMMFDQNRLLRRHAVGDLGTMVLEISRNPAMLVYLDSATNRKAHPNENFAREIMELFCLGEGNYSERDIQELARCFTGWEVRRNSFRFNRFQHDTGSKSILGETGAFGGEEGIAVVLKQKALPRFIVGKLIRFFMFDEPSAPEQLVEPLAQLLRRSDLQIGPVIERILASNLFHSSFAVGRKVRSPVELGIGLLRCLHGSSNLELVARGLDEIGQAVFYPPNVKGWDGGRSWINTSTLLGRSNLVGEILRHDKTRFAGQSLESLATRYGVASPPKLIEWLDELFLAAPLGTRAKQELVEFAAQTSGNSSRRIAELIHTLSTVPQFHLA